MSTQFENYSVSEINFIESAGNDLSSLGVYSLTLTPDTGYSLDANVFSLISSIPSGITNTSFTQVGSNIRFDFDFANGTIMPQNDIEFALCFQGYTGSANFIIQGSVNINTFFSTPLGQIVPYSNTGGFNETEVVFTETITANTNYYFFTEPVMGITTGNAASYAITNSKVYNIDNQLTSITFNVSYTYPNADVTGDLLQINATAIPIIVTTQYVNAYTIDQSLIPAGGDTRVLSLIGDPNAVFSVNLTEVGTGNTTVLANNVTMPATGTYSISGISFPAETSNADPYTIVISGDINPTIANSGADVLLNFTQLSQVTFTVQATATSPISIETPSWEFIAVPNYTYVPGQPNTLNFTFKATSSTGSLTVISTVDADSFSPVIPDPAHPDTLYSIGNIVQGLDASGDFTVSGTITIQTTEDVSIVNILDLDQIISAVTLPTIVTTSITNITGTTATSGGESITDGGGTISDKGIQWSADNFATQMGATSQGDGTTASFASSITGLTAGGTYYVRAFATNELGTAFGAIIQFTSIVTVPCSGTVSAGGSGIQDLAVGLDSSGGMIAFLVFGANSFPDKFEIFHGAADATYGVTTIANKVATSSYGTTVNNFGPFDDTYGTSNSNPLPTSSPGPPETSVGNPNGGVIPTEAQADTKDQFIASDVNPPTRQTEFNNVTGYTVPSMTVGSTTYQQIVWWEYGPGDYNTSTTAILRITAPYDVLTSWEVLRLCCPDGNCTAPPAP